MPVGSPPWITKPGTTRWKVSPSKKPFSTSEANEAAVLGEVFWSSSKRERAAARLDGHLVGLVRRELARWASSRRRPALGSGAGTSRQPAACSSVCARGLGGPVGAPAVARRRRRRRRRPSASARAARSAVRSLSTAAKPSEGASRLSAWPSPLSSGATTSSSSTSTAASGSARSPCRARSRPSSQLREAGKRLAFATNNPRRVRRGVRGQAVEDRRPGVARPTS